MQTTSQAAEGGGTIPQAEGTSPPPADAKRNRALAIRLSMAMFVLVVDTSLMNVSISAVVQDLGTTVSGVQSAIALEALVSAAFILIGSKIGDLYGRKRAYVLGLLGYAVGALAMAFAQGLTAIIVFWAIIGGLGASLLLPSMQSLVHGNFEGAERKRAYALVGAAAAIATAVGPLLGGFITTYLSWRVGFLLEVVLIAVVLSGIKLVRDVPYTGPRQVDPVGAVLSVVGMGGIVLGILVWQEGGERVGGAPGARGDRDGGAGVLAHQSQAAGQADAARPAAVRVGLLPVGHLAADAPADRAGGHDHRPADLPPDGAGVQRDAGRPVHGPALAEHVRDGAPGGEAGREAPPRQRRPPGLRAADDGRGPPAPGRPRADSGWLLAIPLLIAGCGLGLLVSQLNNYALSPISEERVSEAAGVNSAAGSFGLSFGLAFAGAIMLAALSLTFTAMAQASPVLPPADQEQVASALEEDAQIMSNTQLEQQLAGQPAAIQEEIIRINTEARHLALQVALLVPLLAGLIGILNSLRMRRLPDPTPSEAAEGMVFG